MNVSAINTFSNVNFERKFDKKPEKKEHNYQQLDAPVSKNSAKMLKNIMMGLALLGAATSCSETEAEAYAQSEAYAYAWSIGHNCNHDHNDSTIIRDTVINTEIRPVYVKEYPFQLADSLISQGLNIGVELDGPRPNGNNVAFIASKAHNRYDHKYYETQLDSINTNRNTLSLVTKIVDLYDEKNPKTSWMKTLITDVPGKGIKLSRYTSPSTVRPDEWEWDYAGYEVRSNGARRGSQGENAVYDNTGNLIWKGEYLKGQEQGTFLYGTVIYDPNGNPYLDENGNPEKAYYDFDQAKMWSEEVKLEQIPE